MVRQHFLEAALDNLPRPFREFGKWFGIDCEAERVFEEAGLHSDGRTYDIDYNSRDEGSRLTQHTYASITSRSYHDGLVYALMMDDSVKAINNSIALRTWRALATRAGGEVVGDY